MIAAARQSGFTLLEVLVALLVLSVGLIGLAGLQMSSVQNSRDAYYRTQAVTLAYDIQDRMRANLAGANAGDYNDTTGKLDNACLTSTGCSSSDLAKDDIKRWRTAIADNLPSGDGIVCLDATPYDGTSSSSPACTNTGDLYVVKIWWDDDRNPSTPAQLLAVPFHP